MKLTGILILGLMITGCSSVPKYPNTLAHNMTINMKLGDDDKGGFFTSVDAAVGVNDLDAKCDTHYQGYVTLKQGENKIGLKPGQPTFLMIEIVRSTYNTGGSFSRGTILNPVKGAKYVMDFNYVDKMFDLRLYEVSNNKKKKMELVPLSACKPKS